VSGLGGSLASFRRGRSAWLLPLVLLLWLVAGLGRGCFWLAARPFGRSGRRAAGRAKSGPRPERERNDLYPLW
jgi:hypothetical protein